MSNLNISDKLIYTPFTNTDLGLNELSKFQGEWNFSSAAHLLRRATFGAKSQEISRAVEEGLDQTIERLFAPVALPPEPINFDSVFDVVDIGSSWINKQIPRGDNFPMILNSRKRSLKAWQFNNLLSSGISITEKMTLFWHNHFVTELQVVRDPNYVYKYITTCRNHAIGNFKNLVEQITVDPAMLRYLNGNQNTDSAPNENFARELLELFTLGKGALAGEGDYTTFTETDVTEAAKILTGWRDLGYVYQNLDSYVPTSFFVPIRHEMRQKVMSHRFNNTVIINNGDKEYIDLINLIFEREEVAKFICRKIYRWFVYYDISDSVENDIIGPLSVLLRDNNYEIEPILRVLLCSNHFYNICSVGPMIKNPIDFVINLFVQNEVSLPDDLVDKYFILNRLNSTFSSLEMEYFEPPNVAGWKAYYQEPLYYRTWISSVTLNNRQSITNLIAAGNTRIRGYTISVDLIDYISHFKDPFDPNALIDEFVANLFPQNISDNQKATLKEILIPGLPDFEWTVEYGLYINNPEDEEIRQSIDSKLRTFFAALISMAEYYLS